MNERIYAGWTIDEVKQKNLSKTPVGKSLIARIHKLEVALKFYGDGKHIVLNNYDELIEDGEVAREALKDFGK